MTKTEALMARFGNQLAPTPEIRVYRDLDGWWYGSVRLPAPSRQLFLGMSEKLFIDLRNAMFEESARQIEKEFRCHMRCYCGRVPSLDVALEVIPLPRPLPIHEHIEYFTEIAAVELRLTRLEYGG